MTSDHHHPPHAPEAVEISSNRLEAFSDGVFAIAITLLMLDIQVPSGGHLLQSLLHLWPSYCAYVVSFLIIGVVWMNHHTMLFHIRHVDRMLLLLNLLLMMDVAFIPFAAHILALTIGSGSDGRTAAVFYGAVLTIGGLPFNAIWHYASKDHRHLGRTITPEQADTLRRHFTMGPFLYLAATLVGLINAVASLTIFMVLLLFYMIEVFGVSRAIQDAPGTLPVRPPVAAPAPPPAPEPVPVPAPAPPRAAAPRPLPVPVAAATALREPTALAAVPHHSVPCSTCGRG
jgi:uncharacterized membrane protein